MFNLKPKWMIVILGCAFAASASAGNWMRNEGETAYSANLKYSTSDKYWDQFGNSLPKGCTNDSQGLYQSLEYGYSYRYTLFGGIGLDNNHCAGQGNSSGFGDLSLGMRGRIDQALNGKAWEVKAIIPTGYDNQVPMRLGYGRFGLQAGVYFGDQFEDYNSDPYKPGAVYIENSSWQYGAHLTVWEGPPADQLGGYIKYGNRVSQDWKISAALEADLSLGHGTPEPIIGQAWFRNPWHDVLIAKLDFAHDIGDGWSVSVVPEMNVWGRNISQSTAISVGLHKLWGN